MGDLFSGTISFGNGGRQACAGGKACPAVGRKSCSQLETVRVPGSATNSEQANPRFSREWYRLLARVTKLWRKLQYAGGGIASRGGILVRGAFVPVATQFADQVQGAGRENGVLRSG